MKELAKPEDIKKGLQKNRKLTERELEFCRWYSGSKLDMMGTGCELDPVESAKRAGYPSAEAEDFRWRVRQDSALQLQIAVYNQERRGETMAKLQSYARRAADIVMDLAEDAEQDVVKLNAAKLLMQVGGISESPEEQAHRRKQAAATDEFRQRLDEIHNLLGAKEVSYTPFEDTPVPEAKVDGEDTLKEKPDEDDDIVG